MKNKILESLVKNYGFKKTEHARLPTIDYVYPDYIAEGNAEDFRFSQTLRYELNQRKGIVEKDLADKLLVWTNQHGIIREIDAVAPRLGLKELIDGTTNSIYSFYSPILFIGMKGEELTAYIIKGLPDYNMAWFELTEKEKEEVKEKIIRKAEEKPVKGLVQKLKGLFIK